MKYKWLDYSKNFAEIADSFLDKEAVRNTGCEEGFNTYFEYWMNETETKLNENFWCKIIFENDTPIAVVSVGKSPNNEFTISELIVSPAKRGQGNGTKILKELLNCSKDILGEEIHIANAVIYPNNIPSQKAFEKAGFKYTGSHPDGDAWYYQYNKPTIKELTCEDLKIDFLNGFSHNQNWNKQWIKENNSWILKSCKMSREWDKEKRNWIPSYLLNQINRGGIAIGSYVKDKLVGFCSVDGVLRDGYANMTMLFVDDNYKRLGIGRELFLSIVEKAQTLDVKKLFISAIPSQDTVAFYMAMGCKDAINLPNEFLDSPNDRYLELELGKSNERLFNLQAH